jgi:hypothetical protein
VKTFTAQLEPAPRGGHSVLVPLKVAEAEGLQHGARVRGTLNATGYRSSLMKYGGAFYLGVHKATLAGANVAPPARVKVSIELDDEPLPADNMPVDLAKALKRTPRAAAAWELLPPSAKREHVKSVLGAKKAETRVRRVEKIVAALALRR